jgi:enamine deaminase RidA (YjgF/YER057c/UK114 family)
MNSMTSLRIGRSLAQARAFSKASKHLPRNWTTAGRHKAVHAPPVVTTPGVVRIESNERLSEITIHNSTVYLSGQVGDDPKANLLEQTRSALRSIDDLLVTAGSNRQSILSATIFLQNMDDFEEMNTIWDNWIPAWHTPARAVVQGLLPRDVKIELSIIAAVHK